MDKQKLEFFRDLLLKQRERTLAGLRVDRETALQTGDGVVDVGEESELDQNKSTAAELAERESDLLREIDEALQRIDDGTYGECSSCGKPIAEDRLKAMPTARYDAKCQAQIEAAQGIEMPTL